MCSLSLTVINKGQVLTHYYRLMNKNGGYTWLQTCATVVCSSKNAEEQNIICVNYVVSNREAEHMVMDCMQLENGLDSIIKHEDAQNHTHSHDTVAASATPSLLPIGDAMISDAGGADLLSKAPKSETPEPKTRSARNAAAAAAATTTSVSTALDADESAVTTPAARKAHKRKLKALDAADELPTDANKHSSATAHHTTSESTTSHQQRLQPDGQPESSVKDLENAMSKHLPTPTGINNNTAGTTTDFSTDALLKEQQDKSSTIQWIGAHHQHHGFHHQQNAPMPATALLRQLYANRESVIRATARQSANGVFYGKQS